MAENDVWPNNRDWSALKEGRVVVDDESFKLSRVSCGQLKMPSGKLVCCDPFTTLEKTGNPYVQIPAGEYEVIVTLADVSKEHDGSHMREAYASLIIDAHAEEVKRDPLEPTADGKPTGEQLAPGHYFGFGVDAGTASFSDTQALEEGMPDGRNYNWFENLFDNGVEGSWFDRMDDPEHIRKGIANIVLPESSQGNNLILFHSGWGDGFYPVVGGYDAEGNLVAVHIDFFVVPPPEQEEEEPENVVETKKPWWRIW